MKVLLSPINEACLELSISLNHGKNCAMHEINLMIVLDNRIKPCDVGISTKKVLCGQGKILKTSMDTCDVKNRSNFFIKRMIKIKKIKGKWLQSHTKKIVLKKIGNY
jgi:hypothetical protein